MAKFRKKTEVVDAVQFKYSGDSDGPDACALAKSLGLSRHGSSKLWEVETLSGWCIVEYGFWVITYPDGMKNVLFPNFFEDIYEPA